MGESQAKRNGNATPSQRLRRALLHGVNKLSYGPATSSQRTAGKTFYLLNTCEIVTATDWYLKHKPNYRVSGSLEGCEGAKKGYNI